MTLPQCLVSGGYICPNPGSKPTIIVKQDITGVMDPCSVVTPPGPGPGTLTIDSFALDGIVGPLEIGTPVVNPAFLATYTGTPTTITLDDGGINPIENIALPGLSFASVNTYPTGLLSPGSLSWLLTADDGVNNDTASVNLAFQARLFVGWTSDPGPYTEADILLLNQLTAVLNPNALFDLTLNPDDGAGGAAGGVFLVAAYHDIYNGAVPLDFEIGNFGNGGVAEVQTGEPITTPGGPVGYSIARSDFGQHLPAGLRFARES